jgi:hypothetical protein
VRFGNEEGGITVVAIVGVLKGRDLVIVVGIHEGRYLAIITGVRERRDVATVVGVVWERERDRRGTALRSNLGVD